MGRAGLQHRRNYGSDTDGFHPRGSGEIKTYNTAHYRTNTCTNGYPTAIYPMAYGLVYGYPTTKGYPMALAYS